MLSLISTQQDGAGEDEYPLSPRARRVKLDWQAVARAFEAAGEQLGWDADFRIDPGQRHVFVVVPARGIDHVATTTLEFYAAVADRIGMKEFLSLWVDFEIAS
jgi:hypothetical protein